MVFRSAFLFHGVTTWRPVGGITPQGIFPGRRAHVFYTQLKALEQEKTRPPGHFRKTASGLYSSLHSEVEREEGEVDDDPISIQSFHRLRSRVVRWKHASMVNIPLQPVDLC